MERLVDRRGLSEDDLEAEWLLGVTSRVMRVDSAGWVEGGLDRMVGRRTPSGVRALEMRGRLQTEPEGAYKWLSEQLRPRDYVPLLRQDGSDHVVLAMEGRLPADTSRPWVAVAFFAATLLSVLWLGALYEMGPRLRFDLLSGWPYAASLLGILLAHEMGHYVVARLKGLPASLPYFIPMPLPPMGTMGAVIQMKAPPRNRRDLLLLGAAGPLAGMVVAVPVLLYGLSTSEVGFSPPGVGILQEGNSLLYVALKLLVFGRILPFGNVDVHLNSIAWAGWVGVLVTALNLIPAGQLDGGHVSYALFGRRVRLLPWVVIAVLLALSPLWQGWLLWAGLVFFLGRIPSVPLDDVTPLRAREKVLGAVAILLFVLVFTPVPLVVK